MFKKLAKAGFAVAMVLSLSLNLFAAGYTKDSMSSSQGGSNSDVTYRASEVLPEMKVGESRVLGKLGDTTLKIVLVSESEREAPERRPAVFGASGTKDRIQSHDSAVAAHTIVGAQDTQ